MTGLLTILGLLKSLFDLIKSFRGKSKRGVIQQQQEQVDKAKSGQAVSDNTAASLKAKVDAMENQGKSLEELQGESDYGIDPEK